jgi:hypothetical protein
MNYKQLQEFRQQVYELLNVTAHRNCVTVSPMEPQMVMATLARFVGVRNFPSSR